MNLDPQWVSITVTTVYVVFTLFIVWESRKYRKTTENIEKERIEREEERLKNKKMAIRKIIIGEINTNIDTLFRVRKYLYNYVISVLKDMEEEERRKMEEDIRWLEKERGEITDPYLLEPRGIVPGKTDLQKLFKYKARVRIPEDTAYKKFMEHFEILGENETKIFIQIYTELKKIGSGYNLMSDIYKDEDIYIKSGASQAIINDIIKISELFYNLKGIYKKFFNEKGFNEEKLEQEIHPLLRD